MATETRTDEDIVQRLRTVMEKDFHGFRQEALVPYLSYAQATGFMRHDDEGVPEFSEQEWIHNHQETRPPAELGAAFVPFAVGLIQDGRAFVVAESIGQLIEWAWLDGRDDLVAEMEAPLNYGRYGDGVVRLYAQAYGIPWERRGEQT